MKNDLIIGDEEFWKGLFESIYFTSRKVIPKVKF